MAYDSIILNGVEGASLQVTPTLLTWTEAVVVFDDDNLKNDTDPESNPIFALLEAYNNSDPADIVRVGDRHQKYPETFAMRCNIEPFRGSDGTTHFRQLVSYAQPGKFSQVSYETMQSTEDRTFAEDATNPIGAPTSYLTTVEFSFGALTSLGGIGPTPSGVPQGGGFSSGPTMSKVPPVVRIRTPSKLRVMRVTQWEALLDAEAVPRVIIDADRPMWNSDEIWGFAPGELLFIGVDSVTEGTPLHKRTYVMAINQYGWHHFFSVWIDSRGLVDPTILPINPAEVSADSATVKRNGAAAFRMLPSVQFANYFKHLKPPFNVSAGGAEPNTPTDQNPQGDYFPMPGNFA